MVTMDDSYKKQNGYTFVAFVCVSRGNIFERQVYESIFAYVQLHFILNIIMYYSSSYSLHSCFFFLKQKTLKTLFSFNSHEKRFLGTSTLL